MRKSKANSEYVDRFFACHYAELHSLCMKKFRNHAEAEDALHELFEKMHNNAAGHRFPHNTVAAMRYLQRAITNLFNDRHSSSKTTLFYTDDYKPFEVVAEDDPLFEVLLEEVDLVVQQHLQLFTEEQLLLWYCIYFMFSEEEQQQLLCKSSKAIAKLRYKLKRKICHLMHDHTA